eukprot:sb/3467446/
MVLNDQGCCKGDCYLDFGSLEDAKEALKQYKLKLAHRYIDVTKSSKSDWLQAIPGTEKIAKTAEDLEEPILKLDNLPLKAKKQEIIDFFFGIEVRAVQLVTLPRGDCNGEAFVEFLNTKDAAKALAHNKQPLNADSGATTIITVTASSRCDWRREPLKPSSTTSTAPTKTPESEKKGRKRPMVLDHASDRHAPQPRVVSPGPAAYRGSSSSSREYLINAVGLPFTSTEDEIRAFFEPLRTTGVELLKNERGQNRGIAVVGFASEEDRKSAMGKNKGTIGGCDVIVGCNIRCLFVCN